MMWTVTSYLPSGKSLSDSRSMWITNVSPTCSAGSPVKSCSMPDASMATWPAGLRTMSKIDVGEAGIGRVTSMRSGRNTVSGTGRLLHTSLRGVTGCREVRASLPRGVEDAVHVFGREQLVDLRLDRAGAAHGRAHARHG